MSDFFPRGTHENSRWRAREAEFSDRWYMHSIAGMIQEPEYLRDQVDYLQRRVAELEAQLSQRDVTK